MPAKYWLYIAWVTALTATLGSLVMSEMLYLVPCVLCWYQRILMYPLVLLIPVGIINRTPKLHYFILPFAISGALLAFYHWLLQLEILPEADQLCVSGISCTNIDISWFGIVTIPTLSLAAFTVIAIAAILYGKYEHRH